MIRRRKATRRQLPPRELSAEERLAHVICESTHFSGCDCAAGPATCSKMIWAAQRVLKHLATCRKEDLRP